MQFTSDGMAHLKDTHLFFLSSKDSLHIYPDNTPTDFVVELPENISLQNIWACALNEISFKERIAEEIVVLCDMCDSSFISDTKYPILRRISPGPGRNISFNQLLWTGVSRDEVKRIRIYIRKSNMTIPSFITKTVTCTLQLKRVS